MLDHLIPAPRTVAVRRFKFRGFFVESIAPERGDPEIFILYIHGGGFLLGLNTLYRHFAAKLVRAVNAEVWLVDYPLLPEHSFPVALEGCIATYLKLKEEKGPSARVIIMGDSAGGNLAIAMIVGLRERGISLPVGASTLSPWLDLSLSGLSLTTKANIDPLLLPHKLSEIVSLYVTSPLKSFDPFISPLFADFHDFPPLLMIVGEMEILLDDTLRFAAKAKNAGISVKLEVGKEVPHVYPLILPNHPESQRAFGTMVQFIKSL